MFFQHTLHTATSEHFVSIQAQSGLFVAVTAGPGLKMEGREGGRNMRLWGGQKGLVKLIFSRTAKVKISRYKRMWKLG